MSIRIPEGGLSISVDDAGNPNVSLTALHVVYEIWPLWLEIALDHAERALSVRQLLDGVAAGDEQEQGRLLVEECKFAMVGITASVIGLEGFFARVSALLPAYDALRSKWSSQKRKPARPSQVSQVFHRAFRYEPSVYQRLVTSAKELYRIRDAAVHPSADFRPSVHHDVLGVGVEWRFATFTGINAVKAASLACDIIHHSVGVPRTSLPELGHWCEAACKKVQAAHERAASLLVALLANPAQ